MRFIPIVCTIAATIGITCLSTGCRTVSGSAAITPARVQSVVKLGTYVAVRATGTDADARARFGQALRALDNLIRQETWDIAAVVLVLREAGIDGLETEEADLVMVGAVMFFDAVLQHPIDISTEPYARAVIIGARDGISLGLSTPAPRSIREKLDDPVYQALLSDARATRPKR